MTDQIVDYLADSQCKQDRREYLKRWYAANRKKQCDKSKRWREANPEKNRENQKRWDAANPGKKSENTKRWYAANRERECEKARLKYASNPKKNRAWRKRWQDANPEKKRKAELKTQYNLTSAQYDTLLATQNGVCAICKQPNANGNRLSVDHDHRCCAGKKSCGQCVRGLLCKICNTSIGGLQDSPALLFAGIEYIMKYTAQE